MPVPIPNSAGARAAGTIVVVEDSGRVSVFGPDADGARLEGSKVFSKEFLDKHRIPTAAWRRFDRAGAAKSYLETNTVWPKVIKADGLAAGKGVFVVDDVKEACAVVDTVMEERAANIHVADGVSDLSLKKTEYLRVLDQGGLPKLLDELRRQIAKLRE